MKNLIILFFGPPGSGKTTYSQFLIDSYLSLNRKVIYVNLDCLNTNFFKKNSIDFKEILNGQEIMSELHIGSNSSIILSIDYLQNNLEWLEIEMNSWNNLKKQNYFFFDFPGQIELYTHHGGIKNLIQKLNKNTFTLSSLILSDAFYWYDKTNYHMLALSNLMVIFNTEIPFFHILTKTDLLKNYNTICKNYKETTIFITKAKLKDIFSWSNKLNFSLDNIILDFGMINPTPINLTETSHLLDLIKHLEKFIQYSK